MTLLPDDKIARTTTASTTEGPRVHWSYGSFQYESVGLRRVGEVHRDGKQGMWTPLTTCASRGPLNLIFPNEADPRKADGPATKGSLDVSLGIMDTQRKVLAMISIVNPLVEAELGRCEEGAYNKKLVAYKSLRSAGNQPIIQ